MSPDTPYVLVFMGFPLENLNEFCNIFGTGLFERCKTSRGENTESDVKFQKEIWAEHSSEWMRMNNNF